MRITPEPPMLLTKSPESTLATIAITIWHDRVADRRARAALETTS